MASDHYITQQLIAQWKIFRVHSFLVDSYPKTLVDEETYSKISLLKCAAQYPNGHPKYTDTELEFIGEMYTHLVEDKGINDGQKDDEEKGTNPGPGKD